MLLECLRKLPNVLNPSGTSGDQLILTLGGFKRRLLRAGKSVKIRVPLGYPSLTDSGTPQKRQKMAILTPLFVLEIAVMLLQRLRKLSQCVKLIWNNLGPAYLDFRWL